MPEKTLTDKCEISKEYVTLSCFKPGDPNSVLSCIFDCRNAYQEDNRVYCGLTDHRCPVLIDMVEQAAFVELQPTNLKSHVLRRIAYGKPHPNERGLLAQG